jgi:hypothetical protein
MGLHYGYIWFSKAIMIGDHRREKSGRILKCEGGENAKTAPNEKYFLSADSAS